MTTVHVRLDLYSGRENPGWLLDENDAVRCVERVATLSRFPVPDRAPPDGLGYRGVHLTVASDGMQRHFTIAQGLLFVGPGDPAERQVFADPERGLEKWLLATGRSVLGSVLTDQLIGGA